MVIIKEDITWKKILKARNLQSKEEKTDNWAYFRKSLSAKLFHIFVTAQDWFLVVDENSI